MLIQFNESQLQQYKEDMRQTESHLKKYGGRLLFLPSRVRFNVLLWKIVTTNFIFLMLFN